MNINILPIHSMDDVHRGDIMFDATAGLSEVETSLLEIISVYRGPEIAEVKRASQRGLGTGRTLNSVNLHTTFLYRRPESPGKAPTLLVGKTLAQKLGLTYGSAILEENRGSKVPSYALSPFVRQCHLD